MTTLSTWKVVETPCDRDRAPVEAKRALALGAVGAVTSWGSGMTHRSTLRTYWPADLPDLPEILGEAYPRAEDLAEEDWRPHWRASLKPFRAGRSFLLAPPWDESPTPEGLTRVTIDPGMAFGAGDHPTTRLCVAALEELSRELPWGTELLDVGSGTGILALVWAKLSRGRATALDIDPFCFASCRRNARANGVGELVRPLLSSLDLLEGEYPLVAANVVARQLEAMAAQLAARCRPGGLLLLSGFERDAERGLLSRFGSHFDHLGTASEEGWLAVTLRRARR